MPQLVADRRSRGAAFVIAMVGLVIVVITACRMSGDDNRQKAFGSPPPAHPVAAGSASRASSSAPAPALIAPSPPAVLNIPSLKLHAAVDQVVSANGVLGVPADPARVGWWADGAMPGEASGSVVIDGHVDSASSGPGAFFRLRLLHSGSAISIVTKDGRTLQYRVTAREILPKAPGLPARLFTHTGPPHLTLITCGGAFDAAKRSYEDNVVVYAEPTP